MFYLIHMFGKHASHGYTVRTVTNYSPLSSFVVKYEHNWQNSAQTQSYGLILWVLLAFASNNGFWKVVCKPIV